MIYTEDICKLIECFFGYGICLDQHIYKSVMSHLLGNFVYILNNQTIDEQTKKDMNFISLSQISPETVCLNSMLIRFRISSKIQVLKT